MALWRSCGRVEDDDEDEAGGASKPLLVARQSLWHYECFAGKVGNARRSYPEASGPCPVPTTPRVHKAQGYKATNPDIQQQEPLFYMNYRILNLRRGEKSLPLLLRFALLHQ